MKKIIYILCILLTGCGYFENDGTFSEDIVVGNFKILRLKNSKKVEMIFSDNRGGSSILSNNCKSIVFDTINKKIFTENIIDKDYSDYYEILILDSTTNDEVKAYDKMKITKKIFEKKVKNCEGCKSVYPDGGNMSNGR